MKAAPPLLGKAKLQPKKSNDIFFKKSNGLERLQTTSKRIDYESRKVENIEFGDDGLELVTENLIITVP